MAKFQQIQVKMYDDLEFTSWSANVRFVWMVLLTNPNASLCGVQENNAQSLARYTGLTPEQVSEAIAFLVQQRKIVCSQKTNEIVICKWIKHNVTSSPKQRSAVQKQLESVKDKSLLHYLEGASEYLPSLKLLSKPQPQQPQRKLPDELSSYERIQLQKVTRQARAEIRAAAIIH